MFNHISQCFILIILLISDRLDTKYFCILFCDYLNLHISQKFCTFYKKILNLTQTLKPQGFDLFRFNFHFF